MSFTTHDVEVLLNGLVSFTSQGLQQIDLEENFQVIKQLGTGGYGSVLLAKNTKSDQQMALKFMKKSITSERKFLMEFSMSFFLSSHPNIIGSFGIAFKTEDHFVFAQEVAPFGDLFSLITPHVGLPEDRVKRCAVQISSALEFIAEKGLVHMDIKPENVLIFDQECHRVKITDFGLAHFKGTVIKFKRGTAAYMAPELRKLTGEEELAVDSTLDVWAFGVLLYCLITGEFPWKVAMAQDKEFSRFVAWQKNTDCKDPPSSWNNLPERLQRMLRSLLAVDYSQRSKSTEILLYMEESWKTDSTLTGQDQKTNTSGNSSTEFKNSCSHYSSFLGNHHDGIESVSTSMSCQYFTKEKSRSRFEESPVQCQDNPMCPVILVDDQISMFVGAEVELT